jgi:hypothetical protein
MNETDLTMDLWFAGEATDLSNFAADMGTERDRGQLDSSAYRGVPYGRDIMRLMALRMPSATIRQNIEKSPALDDLGAVVTISGNVGALRVLTSELTFEIGGLARAIIA